MSPDSNLTSIHEQVLALIAAGSTIAAAAAAAGVHRNTVGNWMRSPVFRRALADAQYDKAASWREQAESLASAALDTIRATLTDASAPAAVRLKAALSILNLATTPPLPPPGDLQAPDAHPEPLHKNAQQSTTAPAPGPQPPAPAAPDAPESVHKNAQLPPQAQRPRNAPCPCGSGRKFKRCCLGKSPSPAVCETNPIPPKQAP